MSFIFRWKPSVIPLFLVTRVLINITGDTTTRNGLTAASVTAPHRKPGSKPKLLAPVALRAPYTKSLIQPTALLHYKLNPNLPLVLDQI